MFSSLLFVCENLEGIKEWIVYNKFVGSNQIICQSKVSIVHYYIFYNNDFCFGLVLTGKLIKFNVSSKNDFAKVYLMLIVSVCKENKTNFSEYIL